MNDRIIIITDISRLLLPFPSDKAPTHPKKTPVHTRRKIFFRDVSHKP